MQIKWAGTGADDPIYQQCMEASKKMTDGEELEVAMAEIIYEMRDAYKPTPEPQTPTVLFQYRQDKKDPAFKQMSGADKNFKVSRLFAREDVKEYLKKMDHVIATNYANVRMLEEQMAIWFKWGEFEKADAMHRIYESYPDSITLGDSSLWRKKTKNFNKCERIR